MAVASRVRRTTARSRSPDGGRRRGCRSTNRHRGRQGRRSSAPRRARHQSHHGSPRRRGRTGLHRNRVVRLTLTALRGLGPQGDDRREEFGQLSICRRLAVAPATTTDGSVSTPPQSEATNADAMVGISHRRLLDVGTGSRSSWACTLLLRTCRQTTPRPSGPLRGGRPLAASRRHVGRSVPRATLSTSLTRDRCRGVASSRTTPPNGPSGRAAPARS